MTMIYGIKLNPFYLTVEKLCQITRYQNLNSNFSKKMYGNHKHMFLAIYREKLGMSYDRFIKHCEEVNLPRQIGIKKMPAKTTLRDFLKRTPKQLLEKLVRKCIKLIKREKCEASIDATGFSNTNPSHHYIKRSKHMKTEIRVKNYTKATFITDNETKLILSIKTVSDRKHDTLFLKPMVREVASTIKTLLADRGYDSQSNRLFCRERGIEVHIPKRKWVLSRKQENRVSKRSKEEKLFDEGKYRMRALVESVNSAVKRMLGGFVRARTASQQQKVVTLKALTYNIELIGRTIKIMFKLTFQ